MHHPMSRLDELDGKNNW